MGTRAAQLPEIHADPPWPSFARSRSRPIWMPAPAKHATVGMRVPAEFGHLATSCTAWPTSRKPRSGGKPAGQPHGIGRVTSRLLLIDMNSSVAFHTTYRPNVIVALRPGTAESVHQRHVGRGNRARRACQVNGKLDACGVRGARRDMISLIPAGPQNVLATNFISNYNYINISCPPGRGARCCDYEPAHGPIGHASWRSRGQPSGNL